MADTSAKNATTAAANSVTTTANAASAAGSGDKEKPQGPPPVIVNNKNFDVKSYINRYSGFTRIQRLSLIAERCPQDHAPVAAEIAMQDLKNPAFTISTVLYKQVHEQITAMRAAQNLSPLPFDQQWFDTTERASVAQQEKLEKDLNAARASTQKDSIRAANMALGDFFYRRGDFTTALKMYSRMRDQCVTPAHLIDMYMRVIKCSIELKNLSSLPGNVQKASQATDAKDSLTIAKLKVCGGLSDLESRSYKQAARKFLETPWDLASNFNDVIAPHDVGLYGGICGLATFDRSEIKRLILENYTFRQFLDLVPSVHKIVSDFYRCNYTACLDELAKIKLDLMLDIHMHDHIELLCQKIRDKAIVQYFAPYATAALQPMAAAFGTSMGDLEKELSKLIVDGQIQARIDSQAKVLVARKADQRLQVFKQVFESGAETKAELQTSLLTLNLLRNDFCVRDKSFSKLKEGMHEMMAPHRQMPGMMMHQ